jgi:hypothetical protein
MKLPFGYQVPPILLIDFVYHAFSWLISSFKKNPGIAHLLVGKMEFNMNLLTPKGLNVRMVDKPVLVCVT